MPAKNFMYSSCKNKDCEHNAPEGKLCRFCRGIAEDKAIVAERKRKGLVLRPALRCMIVVAKKAVVAKSKAKSAKLIPVAVEDMKIGMTIAPDHGKVISCEHMTGRSLYKLGRKYRHSHKPLAKYTLVKSGRDGILFKTDKHFVFFAFGETVWTVK